MQGKKVVYSFSTCLTIWSFFFLLQTVIFFLFSLHSFTVVRANVLLKFPFCCGSAYYLEISMCEICPPQTFLLCKNSFSSDRIKSLRNSSKGSGIE